jgi:RND family efflux transporter MFP subunit
MAAAMRKNKELPMHPHNPHPPRRRGRLIFIAVVIVVVAAGFIAMRMHEAYALRHAAKDNAVPLVAVIDAARGPQSQELVLPGNVEAWHEAPIYARTSGYLQDWKTDIGTRVKAGELLADIATPEVDSQLRQAEADLKTAEANAKLADSTAKRWKVLLKTDSVSKQEADEKISAASAQDAALASARANRDRLTDLESFKRVTAPFAGTITARNTDTGALINTGSGSGVGPELFHIADTARLRIYIQVPENSAGAIHPGMTAELHFTEHPGKTYIATLFKTADAIDPANRTLLTQFKIDNSKGELLAGGYTEAHLKLPTAENTLRLPVNTLIFRAEGLQVATLGADNKVTLKPITMGRDFGNTVEVTAGLDAGEKVIVNPPDSLATGDEVRINAPSEKKDDTAGAAQPAKDDKAAKDDASSKDSKGAKDDKGEKISKDGTPPKTGMQ